MEAHTVYREAKIEDDKNYTVIREGIKYTFKGPFKNIEVARAYVDKLAKRDFKSGAWARYTIANSDAKHIEDYYTADLIEGKD